MTEREWLACTDPEPMLIALRGRPLDRKLRLFACACCRRIWHLLEARSRQVVVALERRVDGLVGEDALDLATDCLQDVTPPLDHIRHSTFLTAS